MHPDLDRAQGHKVHPSNTGLLGLNIFKHVHYAGRRLYWTRSGTTGIREPPGTYENGVSDHS